MRNGSGFIPILSNGKSCAGSKKELIYQSLIYYLYRYFLLTLVLLITNIVEKLVDIKLQKVGVSA